jgi:hypothetical protein
VNFACSPLLLVVACFMIGVIYHFGPSREQPQWHWILPGSIFAAVIWIAASLLFSWYTSRFGSYNKTYGSLGAAVRFHNLDLDLHGRPSEARRPDGRYLGTQRRSGLGWSGRRWSAQGWNANIGMDGARESAFKERCNSAAAALKGWASCFHNFNPAEREGLQG